MGIGQAPSNVKGKCSDDYVVTVVLAAVKFCVGGNTYVSISSCASLLMSPEPLFSVQDIEWSVQARRGGSMVRQ